MKKLVFTLLVSYILLATVGCSRKSANESGFADVDGARLYFEVAGNGEPIVLIHGNWGDSRHWDNQMETLANHYKVIRYDLRGYGKSSMPIENEAYSHRDDLKALLQELGISKAHIAGYSLGCVVAVDFVLTYTGMCKSLIAVGPWVSGYRSPSARELGDDFQEISSLLKGDGIDAARRFSAKLHYLRPYRPNSEIEKRMKEIIDDFSFWTFIHDDPHQNLRPPAIDQIDKLKLPTLILTADHDLDACRELADQLERTIPNSEKTVISNASHIMMLEKPTEFNHALLEFLDSVEGGE